MTIRPAGFDPQVVRRDFPLFERDFGGRSLAYLDSAATSLKPRAVLDAVEGYNARYTANVHRGIYTTGEEATAAYEDARGRGRRLPQRPGPARDRVRPQRDRGDQPRRVRRGDAGTSGAATRSCSPSWSTTPTSCPWQLLAEEQRRATSSSCRSTTDGRLDQAAFEALLRTRPRLVAFTHKSNALGTLNPVREMVAQAHDAGALVLVDGAQAVPHVPGRRPGDRRRLLRLLGSQGARRRPGPARSGRAASSSRRCRRS